MAVFTRFSEIAARSTIPLHFQIKVHPPPPKLIVPILTPRATTFLPGASFSKWSRAKPDWASVWKHSWNCAKFREEGGGEGCQAAKTKVSSVKSREKNSNSIREKKGRGGDPNRILVVTGRSRYSWYLGSYRDAREIIARFRSTFFCSVRLFLTCPSK